MDSLRTIGLNHIYLDEKLDIFSNIAIGCITRALGSDFKILYFNLNISKELLILFAEYDINFINSIEKFNCEKLKNYDLIICDNCSFDILKKEEILNLLEIKRKNTEVVFVFSKKQEFNEIKENFDLVSEFNYNQSQNENNLINVTGNGKGKSTYSFGYIIRKLFDKKNVGLVYFDKGGDFYSERVFFESLKKFSNSDKNKICGKFEFYVSGMQRFDGKKFRFENKEDDFLEANNGLKLLIRMIDNNEVVIAEELNSAVGLKLLEKNKVLNILRNSKSIEIMITGRYSLDEIIDISNEVIEVVELKHYSKKGHSVRKGIDF